MRRHVKLLVEFRIPAGHAKSPFYTVMNPFFGVIREGTFLRVSTKKNQLGLYFTDITGVCVGNTTIPTTQ
jgi:hypothetical protein